MHRVEVINFLIEKYFNNEAQYLEIGVADPSACFNHINTINKTSVDPEIEHGGMHIDYRMTSDHFFQSLENGELNFLPNHQWDIIFIDGLHLAEQVYKDIQNAVRHVSTNGFVILHDCNPPTWKQAHSDHQYYLNNLGEDWNGTTWKAFYKFRTETNYKTYTIDTDQGLGIVEIGKTGIPIPHTNPWYEYGKFSLNRSVDLNLITPEQFLNLHK
jgi:hypothetical protein